MPFVDARVKRTLKEELSRGKSLDKKRRRLELNGGSIIFAKLGN